MGTDIWVNERITSRDGMIPMMTIGYDIYLFFILICHATILFIARNDGDDYEVSIDISATRSLM